MTVQADQPGFGLIRSFAVFGPATAAVEASPGSLAGRAQPAADTLDTFGPVAADQSLCAARVCAALADLPWSLGRAQRACVRA